VGFVRKKVSPRFVAANRKNSRKSTGPKTELGKLRASLNSAKHLAYAKVSAASMKELGEDPADFEKLRQSLRQSFRPEDNFEVMLVDDLAQLRWRLLRLHRAEAGVLASKKRSFELDRQWKVASAGRGVGAQLERILVGSHGLTGIRDPEVKYCEVSDSLRALRADVEGSGFNEDGLKMLETIYGSKPGVKPMLLMVEYQQCLKMQRDGHGSGEAIEEVDRQNREWFVANLNKEIQAFARLAHLEVDRQIHVTEPMKDAQLILSEEDLGKIMRYEVHLERQFQQKLQLLVAWRRAKREGTGSGKDLPSLPGRVE